MHKGCELAFGPISYLPGFRTDRRKGLCHPLMAPSTQRAPAFPLRSASGNAEELCALPLHSGRLLGSEDPSLPGALTEPCAWHGAGPGSFPTSSEEPFSTLNRPALWMAPSASLEISWDKRALS